MQRQPLNKSYKISDVHLCKFDKQKTRLIVAGRLKVFYDRAFFMRLRLNHPDICRRRHDPAHRLLKPLHWNKAVIERTKTSLCTIWKWAFRVNTNGNITVSQTMISCNTAHMQAMTIRSYFWGLFLEASIHWVKAAEIVVNMKEPVEKKKTPLGWAWEKIHVGGANFGSDQVRTLFYKHSWLFPDCVSKKLTALENGGIRGISRLRLAYGQTQEQRVARFHDLEEGWSLTGGSDDWINSHHISSPQRMHSVLAQGHLKLEVITSTLSICGRDHNRSTAIITR